MLLLLGFASLLPCPSRAQAVGVTHEKPQQENTLIVYLSRTGNTKAVAKIIHQEVGGSLVDLKLVTPYPQNYDAIVAQVVREDETGYLPPLKTRIENIQQYDTVFVGFPTWNMQLPPPIRSFFKQNDLHGKTVIPFNTNGGYGVGSSFRQVKNLCTGCRVLDGFSTRGGLERDGIYLAIKGTRWSQVRTDVVDWLQRIGMLAVAQ